MRLVCDGRLSLQADVPLGHVDQLNKTKVYLVPYQGNKIALYDTSASDWVEETIPPDCELTVPGTSSTPFDIFAYIGARQPKGTKGAKQPKGAKGAKRTTVILWSSNWSTSTSRVTELELHDGVLVRPGYPAYRYLGTGCTTTTNGRCEDSDTKRFLWNYYHRDKRRLQVFESVPSWVSGSNAWQRANNSDNNRVEAVIGVQNANQETNLNLTVAGAVRTATTATASLAVAVGEDSTTTPAGDQIGRGTVQASTAAVTLRAHYHAKPAPGLHYWQWLQIGTAGGNKTWYYTDTSGNLAYKNGITGWIEG
ncbi:MAG: hypothetical protein JNM56_24430 [Planctomycetia bacterium]|nr:hypothetical protein [Planctomycetia bacterium]